MTDLYLIAHKVWGAPAFDIAGRMHCPECHALGCPECDDLGYWWIVGTSGHRAYPYNWAYYDFESLLPPAEMPPNLPDHYPHRAAPTISLTEALGLKPKPLPPILRRL